MDIIGKDLFWQRINTIILSIILYGCLWHLTADIRARVLTRKPGVCILGNPDFLMKPQVRDVINVTDEPVESFTIQFNGTVSREFTPNVLSSKTRRT